MEIIQQNDNDPILLQLSDKIIRNIKYWDQIDIYRDLEACRVEFTQKVTNILDSSIYGLKINVQENVSKYNWNICV